MYINGGFFVYSLLLALIYIAFISLGLPDSLLGSAWPVMHEVFNVPIHYMGIITMTISGCTIISSLMSDRLTKKFKTSVVTVTSVFLTAVALLGFSYATRFWMLILLAIPYGLGAGAIDAALNNYVALHYTSKHMSWLHCFWGVGTIISPLVMGYALSTSVWNNGYKIVSFIQFAIFLLLVLTLPVWNIFKMQETNNDEAVPKSLSLKDALKIKGVLSLLIGFFAYCSAEATAMSWASTYLTQVRNINKEQAATFAALVFIGITAGRFFSGFIMDKLGDFKMIKLGTAISVVGILCIFLSFIDNSFAIVGFVITGLGYAPIYPCIIHATPYNFGAKNSGAIIGIQMASAYVGSTFMPPLYGLLGKLIGFEIMPVFLIIFIILMIIMIEKTFRITSDNASDAGIR